MESKKNLQIIVDRDYLGYGEVSESMLENEKNFEQKLLKQHKSEM